MTVMWAAYCCTEHEQLFYLDSTHATEMGTLHALSTTQSYAARDRLSQLDVASLSIAEFERYT